MISSVPNSCESFRTVAVATSVRFVSAVYSLVHNQISLLLKSFVAVFMLASEEFNISNMFLLEVDVQPKLSRELSPAFALEQMQILLLFLLVFRFILNMSLQSIACFDIINFPILKDSLWYCYILERIVS